MSNELKGEMFAWLTGFFWMALTLEAMLYRGNTDLLMAGFVAWTIVTILGLAVWAIKRKGKQ